MEVWLCVSYISGGGGWCLSFMSDQGDDTGAQEAEIKRMDALENLQKAGENFRFS